MSCGTTDDLCIVQKTDVTIPVTITDANGDAIDLTGSTLYFTAKETKDKTDDNDIDSLIKKTVTSHTDPTAGETEVILTNTDTNISLGSFSYNIAIKDSLGKIIASIAGDFKVALNLTKTYG